MVHGQHGRREFEGDEFSSSVCVLCAFVLGFQNRAILIKRLSQSRVVE